MSLLLLLLLLSYNSADQLLNVRTLTVVFQMFDNIAKLRFEEGTGNEMLACGMISGEGEVMDFRQAVTAEGRVEDWMTSVLNEMRRTNRLITKEAVFNYGNNITR